MANKVKETKKTGRRLKRTVRKTLGTLFLVSALVIGAIPVDGLQAAGEDGIAPAADGTRHPDNISVKPQTDIPTIDNAAQIYTAGDRVFQFVYIPNGTNYTAIIVGYEGGMLTEGSLTIPDKVDAYKQYTANNGQDEGYVAVGKNGNFLFYRETETKEIKYDTLGSYSLGVAPDYYATVGSEYLKEDGEYYINLKGEIGDFKPCSLSQNGDISAWSMYSDSLYYDKNNPQGQAGATSLSSSDYQNFAKVTTEQYSRITNVTVDYISDQYYDTATKKWNKVVAGNPEKGIFAETGNIVNLSWGENLKGVGDYAFYGCTNLDSISFQNGLNVIGEGAFSKCVNLKTVSLPLESNLSAIGAKAFQDCTQLTSFALPTNVTTIGDSAFEGCERLETINLCGEGNGGAGSVTSSLKTLGQDVFRNCKSLQSLTFPDGCDAKVYISSFAGCESLKYICARNEKMSILPDGDYYNYDDFKEMLGEDTDFYFEGIENSTLHEMCKENCFAFSYIGGVQEHFAKKDLYEITMKDEDGDGTSTYVVNANNVLVRYEDQKVEKITIPAKIGPYSIETIGTGVFQNLCNLKEVTILDKVKGIESNAFRGCHSLEFVNFSAEDIQIAAGAFDTQDFSGTTHKCGGNVATDGDGYPECKLHFVGPISPKSGSYQYAMSSTGKYNNNVQQPSYIIYCSGLPQNLEIVYNESKGMSELVDFPALSELAGTTKYNPDNYAYIDDEFVDAARVAVEKYRKGETMTEYEADIIDSALNIVIPDGVESVKPGLFLGKDKDNNLTGEAWMTVTAYSLHTIESGEETADGEIAEETGTFAGCEHLTGVSLLEGSEGKETIIEDYAFQDCVKLRDVTLAPTVTSIGIAPFYGCSEMSDINFQNSPHFSCVNSIIYGLDGDGNRTTLIECLEGRTLKEIPETELTGVTALQKEAFRGSNVRVVNLKGTSITTIPVGTFAETEDLTTVYLPSSLRRIDNYAFAGSNVDTFYVYGTDTTNNPFAFAGLDKDSPYDKAGLLNEPEKVTWYCVLDTTSYDTGYYAEFRTEELPVPAEYKVNFEYYNRAGEYVYQNSVQTITNEYEVVYPEDVAEQITDEDGILKFFDGWERRVNEETNTWTYTAKYRTITWTVTVMDSADRGSAVLGTLTVVNGFSALNSLDALLKEKVPEDVYNSFSGWSCSGDLNNVTQDLIATATYTAAGEYVIRYYAMVNSYGNYELYNTITVKEGENAPDIAAPRGAQYEISGYTFSEWENLPTNVTGNLSVYAAYKPNSSSNNPGGDNPGGDNPGGDNPGGDNPGGNNPGGNNPSGGTTLYTLTVQGGSGSGSYAAGAQVIITADAPARGQTFSSWTVSPADTVVTDKTLSSMIITMPERDVAAIANYKASSSSGGSTNPPNGSGGSNTPGSGTISSGTTVVIDKNGLSNTGVVSATVNGSSDNFTIKVTENSSATEAVLKALQAEYGSLDNVKYFPMDISLYDSTGTKKITDTRGLSISITLPLPDSLIAYAGNNKVAGVVNDKLDKLTPRFTTINGVACVTFTAEHFSPYVIYVDITNLSDGATADSTPKTADGIHPKWFLVVGFACLSFVMFMMKDGGNKSRKKQKVLVRA